jgi:UDP-N-acetylmuramoylalanine--D-glutamate ligase
VDFVNRRYLVVGAGISGIAAAKLAKKMGASVCLTDAKEEADIKYDLAALRAVGIELALGEQTEALLTDVDCIIVSPAVPIGIALLQKAKQKGIAVISEVEMAYRLAQAPLYAVTGTNGKTTTTTLLGLLLKERYEKVGVGGNIGNPLCEEVTRVGTDGCTIAEISSYQLEGVEAFHPHIAAVLNVTPDHIARHGSVDVYQSVKERIFSQQTDEDFLVLNYDDARTRSMAQRAKSQVAFFSRQEILSQGAFVKDGWIVIAWENQQYPVCPVDDILIKGGHNVENVLAAVMVAFFADVALEKMARVLKSFAGVEHRIEPVKVVNGVAYYNDSKATNPESAIKAVETFAGHIILLAGGHDKNTDLSEFMGFVCKRVDYLILVGAASDRFKEAALAAGFGADKIYEAGYSLEDAVKKAHETAKTPQVVLLSPACASYDMFEGYEERGRAFKQLVNTL